MDWCDTSSIDWDAVGAIGTWAVGIAAMALAIRTDSLARRLQRVEHQRETNLAYATARGLLLELTMYANRLNSICDGIETLVDRSPQTIAADSARWLDTGANFRLPESFPSDLVGTLPKELGAKLSELFVRERAANAIFVHNAQVVRQPVERPADAVRELIGLLTKSAAELRTLAGTVEEIRAALQAFLASAA